MSRPQVCLIADPCQWGFLNGTIPETSIDAERVDVTWIGMIKPREPVLASEVRPVHDVSSLPALPVQGPDEDAQSFLPRLEIAKAEQRAALTAITGESEAIRDARSVARNRALLERLVDQGIFAGIGPDGAPIPHAIQFSIAALGEGATMAHIMVALKVFPSIGQARRNGHTGPLVLGRQVVTKKKIVIEIVP